MKLVLIVLVLQFILLTSGSESGSGEWEVYCPQCGVAENNQKCCCLEKIGELSRCDQNQKPAEKENGFCCDYKKS